MERKGNIIADARSCISWPIPTVARNAEESAAEADCHSEHELNAVFPAWDLPMRTVNEVPPLTLEEKSSEQRRDVNLVIVRECRDAVPTPTPEEEGLPKQLGPSPNFVRTGTLETIS